MMWDSMMSFASSLMFLQMYLLIGLYSHNFGGSLNFYLDQLLLKSNKTFFDGLTDKFSSFISGTSKEFAGAGYWRLAQNGYIPSPILEDTIGMIILTITSLYMLILPKPRQVYEESSIRKSLYDMMREAHTGATVSLMIPLNLSAINCIYACTSSSVWTGWGVASFLISLGIIAYYGWFAFYIRRNLIPTSPILRVEINDIYHLHMNFDLNRVYAKVGLYYAEYYLFQIFILTQTVLANLIVLPLLLGITLFILLLLFFIITPRQIRSEDFVELNRIHLMKKVVVGLRILTIVLFLIFGFSIMNIDVGEVRVYTILCYLLLAADFVVNIYIIQLRVKSILRPGTNLPYPRMNEDYVELMDGGRNKLLEPVLFERPIPKESVYLGARDLLEPRQSRFSYKTNALSEIPVYQS